ncbi:MAG: cellulase family glycosylhydrolase [Fibrobacter sp.]|nr:cellulase family glycosylhydrolase [Fibrobacter sp.]
MLFGGFCHIHAISSDWQSSSSFQISQGINLNEWFERVPLDSVRLDTLVTYEKLDLLKKLGFDHVRIPINEESLFDEEINYRTNILNILLDRINYCKTIGLKVVLDLHVTRNHRFGRENNLLFQSKLEITSFLKVWEKLQDVFSQYSDDFLAYECLNEPAAPEKKHFLWNDVLKEWVQFIRKKEPNRILFIGSNRGNQIWTFKYLDIPPDDPNLILSFHFYKPSLFTHYKASWGKHAFYKGEVHYPGQTMAAEDFGLLPDSLKKRYKYTQIYYDKKYISNEIVKVVKIAKKNNLPLNLGEFGCLRNVSDSSRYQWFRDVVNVMRENNISYTLWGMNGAGFGIWEQGNKLDSLMIKSLIQETAK